MALRAFLTAMIVAVVIAPALAADYMVGDNSGWNIGVNYTEWAKGKEFYVGDTISFIYAPGKHNVLKVNGTDFQKCSSSNLSATPYTSGNDSFTLATPGKKWYICSFTNHCTQGMKLVINVGVEGPTPSPLPFAPTPGSSAATTELYTLKSCVWMIALMAAAYRMIVA